jgi:SAM-dependent methyltransferase
MVARVSGGGARLNPLARRGFTRGAAAYARARPGYPAPALDWALEQAGLSAGDAVADVGAGTGLLSALLVERGLRVLAVEPLEEMRGHLTATVPQAEVRPGTAEDLPVPDSSLAAVFAANAFHWFDAARAPAEIHRALRPGGALVLVWGLRDTSDPLQARLEEISQRLLSDTDGYPTPSSRTVLERSGLFRPAGSRRFPYHQELDESGLLDLVSSWSVVGAAEPPVREAVLGEVAALVAGRGTVSLTYRTAVQVWRAGSGRVS